jgi:phosphomannomutase / phosphoglucomutase
MQLRISISYQPALAVTGQGLVRASSNKPELVVVESPVSEARMRDMFKAIDDVLRTHREVGAYNQTI